MLLPLEEPIDPNSQERIDRTAEHVAENDQSEKEGDIIVCLEAKYHLEARVVLQNMVEYYRKNRNVEQINDES